MQDFGKAENLENRIVAWARGEENIRAVVITGSQTRNDGSVDEWSDVDAQLIVTNYQPYISNQDWLSNIGRVWVYLPLEVEAGLPTCLVWFEGGKKVDFSFCTLGHISPMLATGELSDEYQRGYKVALDKDGLFKNLPPSPNIFPPAPPPTPAEFQFIVQEFWFEAIHVAQFIRRRELWVAKFRDWTMKQDLLQMMEWHAQIHRQVNTWVIGKRIAEWTDQDTWQAIHGIWGQYEVPDSWRALFVILPLFHRLAGEVARTLNYEYAAATYEEIMAYIEKLHTEDS